METDIAWPIQQPTYELYNFKACSNVTVGTIYQNGEEVWQRAQLAKV